MDVDQVALTSGARRGRGADLTAAAACQARVGTDPCPPVRNLTRRPGSVDEITPMIVHLVSDDSTYSTGADFVVDGGATATSRLPDAP